MSALHRWIPLRWLLAGCFGALLALSLAGLGALIYSQVDGYLWRAGESRLRYQIESKWNRQVFSRVTPGSPRLYAPVPGFPSWAGDLALQTSTADVHARVLLPDGTVLAAQGGPAGGAPPVDRQQVAAMQSTLAAGGRADGAYAVRHNGERWQVAHVPLYEGARYVGVVQAAHSLRDADALLAALARYLLVGGGAALVAGVAASLILARTVAVPLERIATTARRVTAGDLDARTGLPAGRSELLSVAGAFDEMVSRVQSSFREQRRFLADASHELKTPLTAIGGMAELLRAGAAGAPAERERALRTIEREVDRMSRLVHDLLALSRADQHPALERTPVDLAGLAAELADEASLLSPQLAFRVSNGAPVLTTGDHDYLTRALRNVIDNARQHTPAGGSVLVDCAVRQDQAVVTVRDTGAGIPPQHLPHVFERFYRADASRSRRTGGSGLGLSIVRSIVEWHGGAVAIDSFQGQGTTVTVRLPALAAAAGAPADRAGNSSHHP
jgi:two-component system OmpR family sensor kinase